MNKRERLLRAFDFQETDRVPIVDWIQHGGLAAVVSGRDVSHDFWTLAECGKQGGLLLGSSGQVHPGCKTENVLAMYETALSTSRHSPITLTIFHLSQNGEINKSTPILAAVFNW